MAGVFAAARSALAASALLRPPLLTHSQPPHPSAASVPVDRIRNIGIIAHIDAGKTTTTERMLYYVGYTKRIGEVDQGSTVTDFLKPERERGITIASACIPFAWRNHRINLIDTPGHVDFTIEVERSMRVLDGAVCVLDAVAGVEAQTETVWRQANRYKVPRIAFVNKMDRNGAGLGKTVKAMETRLTGWGRPLVCQWPVVRDGTSTINGLGSGGPGFEGVVDLLSMDVLDWRREQTGSVITRSPLTPESDGSELYDQCLSAREALVEALSDIDERIVEIFLDVDGDHLRIPAAELRAALRRVTLNGKGIPIFCGASFRNIGVQPVLDAICDFLPCPADRPPPHAVSPSGKEVPCHLDDKEVCALAFKVTHDPKRGALVFVRVYSGTLERGATLINPATGTKERATKLLQMYADDYEEIASISAGNIAAVSGLKETATGDTLLSSRDKRGLILDTIAIPPPVFVRSCEPVTSADERALSSALKALVREDPSVHVAYDDETGQTLISGMGELHLEITADRLEETHKVNCKMGKVNISYRETIDFDALPKRKIVQHIAYDRETFGKRSKVSLTLEIEPLEAWDDDQLVRAASTKQTPGGNQVVVALARDNYRVFGADLTAPTNLSTYASRSELNAAVQEGLLGALGRGPLLGFPLTNLRVTCTDVTLYGADMSHPAALRAAAAACLREALAGTGSTPDANSNSSILLLEPVMDVSVRVPEKYIGVVTKDVAGTRRGHVLSLGEDTTASGDDEYARRTVAATVPLAQLVGYASALRGLTAGTGDFAMELRGYGVVQQDRVEGIMHEIRGY
ncbi:Ribosome-releasing factor 2, mitochondrial [Geranomyces variabilis]|uniref:Ribosome-releasing factor 2, mitochondrial n=1 Tax=Geranomyces variabilis TaxID=109894 RepID=A0AAD5TTV3_9FUNG|nr:Ribosome-releasing factor 2, mitochondrial [Geranomyces variabilis]